MDINRRRLIVVSALTGAVLTATLATPAVAAPLSAFGVDTTQLGVRAGGGADQSNMLQAAIDKTAGARVPLMLGPGEYRVGGLKLPRGTQLIGVHGATRLVFTGGAALISARGADYVTLAGLVLEGGGRAMEVNGLLYFAECGDLRIMDCEVINSGRSGIRLEAVQGAISGTTVAKTADVTIYSEFGFEGAVIANNTIDGAALGIVACNFNEGGRLAVVQGNLIRNLKPKRPAGTDPGDRAGIGIGIEADASVTGNVIENAPYAGIVVGWGAYMRDVSVVGNVVRGAPLGIAVSVTSGAGTAVITGNLISGASRGAIVGMDHAKVVAGDLSQEPARYANLQVSGNRMR